MFHNELLHEKCQSGIGGLFLDSIRFLPALPEKRVLNKSHSVPTGGKHPEDEEVSVQIQSYVQ